MLYWELNADLTFTNPELHLQPKLALNFEFSWGNSLGLQVYVIRPPPHVFDWKEHCDEARTVIGDKSLTLS